MNVKKVEYTVITLSPEEADKLCQFLRGCKHSDESVEDFSAALLYEVEGEAE